ANPFSLIASAAMLLIWLSARTGRPECAEAGRAIETALDHTIARVETRTRDLGGTLGTQAFTQAVIKEIGRG
ncbi:MAG: 3-isopropylmalate dehydrogenase, partial [Hyphomicrobiales bacterium]|nr:3-isopropylmalate dehydrogenase [Hyphomicrobiales bacterium]